MSQTRHQPHKSRYYGDYADKLPEIHTEEVGAVRFGVISEVLAEKTDDAVKDKPRGVCSTLFQAVFRIEHIHQHKKGEAQHRFKSLHGKAEVIFESGGYTVLPGNAVAAAVHGAADF